jgi:hypothetical protein
MPIAGTRVVGSGVSGGDSKVEIDLEDGGFVAIDSWATRVNVSGGDIPFNEALPFTGGAEVFVGAKSSYNVEVEILYTEGSTDPYANLIDAYIAGNDIDLDVRWTPKGDGTGGFRYTTSGGKLISINFPQVAGDADAPNVITFTVQAGSIARDTES